MIIDCHTHMDPPDRESVSDLRAAAQTVDACVVLACLGRDRDQINQKLARSVQTHRDKLIGFAVIEPTQDKINERAIQSLTERQGLKGVVLYCSAYGFHPCHSRAMQFYEVAEDLGLPVFFHNSELDMPGQAVLAYTQPYLLDEIARAFPRLKMVVGRMGAPFVEQTLALIAHHENVYADLTIRPGSPWQTYNIVVAAYERAVMDKLVFGSGFPMAVPGSCIETLLGFNMLLSDTNLPSVPRASVRQVVERNSLELLGIDYRDVRLRDPDANLVGDHESEEDHEQ